MRTKANNGRSKDVAITDVTAENYIVPENEQNCYHCIIEVKKFNAETGERLSRPRVQKFGYKAFRNGVLSNLKKQGYTVTILYDPTEYLKEKEKELARAKTASAKASAEVRKAEIDQAVAEALKKANEENEKKIAEAVKKALAEAKK